MDSEDINSSLWSVLGILLCVCINVNVYFFFCLCHMLLGHVVRWNIIRRIVLFESFSHEWNCNFARTSHANLCGEKNTSILCGCLANFRRGIHSSTTRGCIASLWVLREPLAPYVIVLRISYLAKAYSWQYSLEDTVCLCGWATFFVAFTILNKTAYGKFPYSFKSYGQWNPVDLLYFPTLWRS